MIVCIQIAEQEGHIFPMHQTTRPQDNCDVAAAPTFITSLSSNPSTVTFVTRSPMSSFVTLPSTTSTTSSNISSTINTATLHTDDLIPHFLSTRYPQFQDTLTFLHTPSVQIHGKIIGPAYRMYLRHRLIEHVCGDLKLDPTKPGCAQVVMDIEGVPSIIQHKDVAAWSSPSSPSTYRNKKTLMRLLEGSLQEITQRLSREQILASPVYCSLYPFACTVEQLRTELYGWPSLQWNYLTLEQHLSTLPLI